MNTKEKLQAQINKIDNLKKLTFENTQKDIWIVETLQLLEAHFNARHVSNFDRIFNHGCVLTDDWNGQKEYLKELKKAEEFLHTITSTSECRIMKQSSSRYNALLKYLSQLWQELKDFIAKIISNLIKN
ncbi:hypothetical protein COT20_02260 [bacterium (Candidatus Gribaldobacteria) CG08_land_8_20_14_0_20_39_15]|uniref:Uncharacterized protein n=1 Tax=bacterium (Candidatus Gribaldobacteria) CG08_land_8_20_14_0_20_39_15 TaxID=2014273 RepID=A0A2M6XU35_9BACT|nr:MAG: hypothetical protein COT20_02260 [bacterium (Candidatus Gribaldobacteria) CG08_land_8_20_14_0_20_39_15]